MTPRSRSRRGHQGRRALPATPVARTVPVKATPVRPLQTEWAYREVFTSNDQRSAALAPWLEHYNTERRHTVLDGHAPTSRVSPT